MNTTDNISSLLNTTSYQCEEPYPDQGEIVSKVAWWLEGFTQIIIGCMGFAGNTIAIPVLSSRKLNSIFNRILVFLAGTYFQRLFLNGSFYSSSTLVITLNHKTLPIDHTQKMVL